MVCSEVIKIWNRNRAYNNLLFDKGFISEEIVEHIKKCEVCKQDMFMIQLEGIEESVN
jgi:hypothetical protein